MFYTCDAPLLGLLVVFIFLKLDKYFQKRKFKKLEAEMRAAGVNEYSITAARHFFTN
ncbi:hypothetical protein R83H12_00436 [Fibrobacteria bacterium R8-3-H12]